MFPSVSKFFPISIMFPKRNRNVSVIGLTEMTPRNKILILGSVHADASFLDEWSFDQFQSLLNRSNEDPKLKELLLQDNLVVFLHLLGCDSNGHAHRPFSSIYLNNVKVVDHIAERVYNLLESYFKDNRTSYIFTADHGMSDKGRKISEPMSVLLHGIYLVSIS